MWKKKNLAREQSLTEILAVKHTRPSDLPNVLKI